MSENIPRQELNAFEASLVALKPASGGIDRETLMFRAGQESMRPRGWLWPGATAAMALTAAMLGGLIVLRPTITQVVYVEVEKPAFAKQESPPRAAERGPDSLPRETLVSREDQPRRWERMLGYRFAVSAPAPTYAAPRPLSIDRMLDLPPTSLDPISRSRLDRALLRSGEPL
jgi:hypothetical protein